MKGNVLESMSATLLLHLTLLINTNLERSRNQLNINLHGEGVKILMEEFRSLHFSFFFRNAIFVCYFPFNMNGSQ